MGGHLDVLRGTWKPHPPRILLERQEAARRFFPCLSIVLDALEVQHLLHACGGEMSGKGQAVSNRDTASELPVGGGGGSWGPGLVHWAEHQHSVTGHTAFPKLPPEPQKLGVTGCSALRESGRQAGHLASGTA